MKRLPIFLIVTFLSNPIMITSSDAQIDGLGTFLATGSNDAQKLFGAYLSPWINGFGTCLTGGWYSTAKVHKPGGFDFSITTNTARIPTKYNTYDVNDLKLENFVLANQSYTVSSTVAGDAIAGPQLNYYFNNQDLGKAFELPKGTSINIVPSAMAQLSIGLIKGTEISVRYLPPIKIRKNNSIGLWGAGIKHSLKQWIPAVDKIPFLNLTIQGGYTRLTTKFGVKITPTAIGLSAFEDQLPSDTWNDQQLMMHVSSFTGNILISADIPFFSFYAGIGFASTITRIDAKGVYPGAGYNTSTNELELIQTKKDPFSLKVKNQEGGATKPRISVGSRLKLGFFTLFGEYTYASYTLFTGGIGVTFR